MFYDVPPSGSGFNADQLHEATLRALWNKLKEEHPGVLQAGRDAALQQLKGERSMAALKTMLAKAVGTENVKLALDALARDAKAALQAEDAAAAQERERTAIEGARAKLDEKQANGAKPARR